MAMITCPECVKEISDKAKTCIHCGCPIGEQEQPEVTVNTPNKSDMNSIFSKVKSGDMKKKAIAGIAVALVVILVVAFALGGTDDAQKVKKLLCDGVYYEGSKNLSSVGLGYSNGYFYEFSKNNTYKLFVWREWNPVWELDTTGTYTIDTKNCQILLTEKTYEYKMPYHINEYTHDLELDTRSDGSCRYRHLSEDEIK